MILTGHPEVTRRSSVSERSLEGVSFICTAGAVAASAKTHVIVRGSPFPHQPHTTHHENATSPYHHRLASRFPYRCPDQFTTESSLRLFGEPVANMSKPRYPSLYQINTRVWLTELARALGRPATLDDIPEAELDRLAELGFDWVWLLSVWQTGRLDSGSRAATQNGARSLSRRCRTCARRILPVPDLPLPAILSTPTLEVMHPWRAFATAFGSAGCDCCWILSPITLAWITRGWRSIPNITCPGPRSTWLGRHRILPGLGGPRAT